MEPLTTLPHKSSKEKATISKLTFGVSESYSTLFTLQSLPSRLKKPRQRIKKSRNASTQFPDTDMHPMKPSTWSIKSWWKILGKDQLLMISSTVTSWSWETKFTKNSPQSVPEDLRWKRTSKICPFGLIKKSWTWTYQMLKRTINLNKILNLATKLQISSSLRSLKVLEMETIFTYSTMVSRWFLLKHKSFSKTNMVRSKPLIQTTNLRQWRFASRIH